jgi:mannose-6-phosphate isomerase-like protein (cupin superfamily)
MPTLIDAPQTLPAAGNRPKRLDEYVGRVRTGQENVSVAHMFSPSGWQEPGQEPEFEEISVVLRGTLYVETREGLLKVKSGQALVTHPGEWVRYSSPEPGGAEYIAVCLPAFSPQTVNRDAT